MILEFKEMFGREVYDDRDDRLTDKVTNLHVYQIVPRILPEHVNTALQWVHDHVLQKPTDIQSLVKVEH